jgi:uncharacterized membrane protein
MLTNPTHSGAEELVMNAVLWLKLGVEVTGAAVIGFGLLAVLASWLQSLRAEKEDLFGEARLKFARYLALALELQLGADILSTAVAPSWDQIGKLAAIAVIRTALNYFLRQELHGDTAHVRKKSSPDD